MTSKKIIMFLLVTINLKAFCPPCHCTDALSISGKASLISTQVMILSKTITPTLLDVLKETIKLKKEEEENLNLTKKLVAYEYYKTLKLKEILKDVQKQKNLLYLKLKAVQNLATQQILKNRIFLNDLEQK